MPEKKQQELFYKLTHHKFIIDILLLIIKQETCQKRELVEFLLKYFEIPLSSGYRLLKQMEKDSLLTVHYHSDLGLYYKVPLAIKRYLLKILTVQGQLKVIISNNVVTQLFQGYHVKYTKIIPQISYNNSPKIIVEPLLD